MEQTERHMTAYKGLKEMKKESSKIIQAEKEAKRETTNTGFRLTTFQLLRD